MGFTLGGGPKSSGGGPAHTPSSFTLGGGPRSSGLQSGPSQGSSSFTLGGGPSTALGQKLSYNASLSGGGGHHRGLFGSIGHAIGSGAHWTAQKADLAAHDVKAIPGGLVATGEALFQPFEHPLRPDPTVGKQWLDLLEGHPIRSLHEAQKPGSGTSKDAALLLGAGKATKAALEHPLRDPFETALTVGAILSGSASALAKGSYAADAAKAGELGNAAKALLPGTRVPSAPRLLRVGDSGEEIGLHPSGNHAVRAVQAGYDRALQRALDRNPEGRLAAHANRRVGGSIAETARYQQRMRAVPADQLQAAARRLAPGKGRLPGSGASRFRRTEEAALELTSVNTTPEAAAAYHLAQARKGVNPDLNTALAKLYQQVARRGLLTTNEHGDVIVNSAQHPLLAQADVHLAQVQGRGDEILARYGARPAEALQERVNAPGRVRAGAIYEKPTPGKAGVSPALEKANVELGRLARLHEKALDQEARWHADTEGGTLVRSRVERPRTEQEARAELASLQGAYEKLVSEVEKRVGHPHLNPDEYAGEQARRNLYNNKVARSRSGVDSLGRAKGSSGKYTGARFMPTVKQEIRAAAERHIDEMIAAHPHNPRIQELAGHLDAITNLRNALNPLPGDPLGDLGTLKATRVEKLPPASNPFRNRIVRLGILREAAQQRVDRLAAAAEKRVKPTGVVGGETARPGRGFVSYRIDEPKAPRSPVASASGPVIGEPRAPVTGETFTGSGIEQGLVPSDVTGQAARHFRQILRFANTSELRSLIARTGSQARRSSRDVLIKIPGEKHAEIPASVQHLLGKSKLTVDDVAGIEAALEAYRHDLLPGLADRFAGDKATGIGTPAPEGHLWVDRGVLGDLAKPQRAPRGRIARSVDAVNSAVTAATVYFKVGHAGTRALTNAATNIVQGSADPVEIGKSISLWRQLDETDRLRALAAAGQHSFRALPHEGAGRIARFAGAGANWWARHFDAPFRFSSLAHEAREAGYTTAERFRTLLDQLEHPDGLTGAERARVEGVAKRANREAIAYDRLNQFERDYITRAFWFYPWTRAAVGFAGNTILEHPYKAVELGQVGTIGRERQQDELGALPSYEYGLFKLGHGHGYEPTVADFSTFNPYATAADLLNVASGKEHAADYLNPAAAGAGSLLYGIGQHGRPSTSPLLDSLRATVAPAWPVQLLQAYTERNQPQERKMFPRRPDWWGTYDTALRALLGPGMPRRYNPQAGASAAARQKAGR